MGKFVLKICYKTWRQISMCLHLPMHHEASSDWQMQNHRLLFDCKELCMLFKEKKTIPEFCSPHERLIKRLSIKDIMIRWRLSNYHWHSVKLYQQMPTSNLPLIQWYSHKWPLAVWWTECPTATSHLELHCTTCPNSRKPTKGLKNMEVLHVRVLCESGQTWKLHNSIHQH